MAIVRICGALAVLAATGAGGQAAASSFNTLFSMNGGSTGYASDGRPLLAKNGLLYGTAYAGGANGGGLLFSFNPVTGTYTKLQEWTTYGADGMTPAGTLLLSKKGVLYGIAEAGGTESCSLGCGTLWAYDTVKGSYTTLYQFSGGADGLRPLAGLAFDAKQKTLYGTTAGGGDFKDCPYYGCGTVFAFTIASHVLTTLHSFSGPDGNEPASHPLLSGGLLYGTTPSGGAHGSGNLWRLDPTSGAFTSLHDFDYHVDGSGPEGELLLSKGVLYGEAHAGGNTAADDGTLYSYSLASGEFTTLYAFQGAVDGSLPEGGLVVGAKGMLYGTSGSQNGAGQIFGYKLSNATVTQVHQFGNGDGALPQTGLTPDGAGGFFGVTSYPPSTIFQIVP